MSGDPRLQARDRGLRRLSSLTGWIAAGSLAIAGTIAVALGATHHQPAATSTTVTGGSGANAPADGSQIGAQDPTTGFPGLQPPVSAPQPGFGGGGGIVSGGS
jgi:hypothetical protein